jgi:hypothetical protein
MVWFILLVVVVVGAVGWVAVSRRGRHTDHETVVSTRGKDEGRGYTPTSI